MKKVLYGGAFDIFHWMHLEAIRQAKSFGDYLVDMVNSDRLIEEYKGRKPLFTQEERMYIIRSLRFVDEVVLKHEFSDIPLLQAYDIDVLVHCEEWKNDKAAEIEFMERQGKQVVFTPYLRSEMMPDVKAKFEKIMQDKGRVFCEECHKLI